MSPDFFLSTLSHQTNPWNTVAYSSFKALGYLYPWFRHCHMPTSLQVSLCQILAPLPNPFSLFYPERSLQKASLFGSLPSLKGFPLHCLQDISYPNLPSSSSGSFFKPDLSSLVSIAPDTDVFSTHAEFYWLSLISGSSQRLFSLLGVGFLPFVSLPVLIITHPSWPNWDPPQVVPPGLDVQLSYVLLQYTESPWQRHMGLIILGLPMDLSVSFVR
jgi:hypothetical protein